MQNRRSVYPLFDFTTVEICVISDTFRSSNEETVSVLVGASEVKFIIPRKLLIGCSGYFYMKLEFENLSTDLIYLRDEDPGIFAIFNDWLHTDEWIHDMTDDRIPYSSQGIANLYILGRRLQIQRLRNSCIDAIIKHSVLTNYLLVGAVSVAYNSPIVFRHDPLRRLLVDIHAWGRNTDHLRRTHTALYPEEFLIDVMVATAGIPKPITESDAPFWQHRRRYYKEGGVQTFLAL